MLLSPFFDNQSRCRPLPSCGGREIATVIRFFVPAKSSRRSSAASRWLFFKRTRFPFSSSAWCLLFWSRNVAGCIQAAIVPLSTLAGVPPMPSCRSVFPSPETWIVPEILRRQFWLETRLPPLPRRRRPLLSLRADAVWLLPRQWLFRIRRGPASSGKPPASPFSPTWALLTLASAKCRNSLSLFCNARPWSIFHFPISQMHRGMALWSPPNLLS